MSRAIFHWGKILHVTSLSTSLLLNDRSLAKRTWKHWSINFAHQKQNPSFVFPLFTWIENEWISSKENKPVNNLCLLLDSVNWTQAINFQKVCWPTSFKVFQRSFLIRYLSEGFLKGFHFSNAIKRILFLLMSKVFY